MKRFLLEYLPAWLLLAVFGFIVIHAPLTVWLGTQLPQVALPVKAWKEAMTLLALVLLAAALYQKGLLRVFTARPLITVMLLYAALHIFMLGIYPQGVLPTVAGLLIDLRYVLYFVAVCAFLYLYPAYAKSFIRVGIVGAVIVVGFAVLQLFLPKDILTQIGYGSTTIEPYLTVDKNPDYVRYNSTLRGPNPLGAYAVIVLAGVVAFGVKNIHNYRLRVTPWALAALFAAGVVALWVSYSRSAMVGALAAGGIMLAVQFGRRMDRRVLSVVGIALVATAGLMYVAKDTTFVQNVIFHNNPTTGANVDSNAAHADSLAQGLERMAVQPLGAGIGSTGSASLLSNEGLIIENQYLMIAHEVGWLGIMLFLFMFGMLMHQLWKRRKNWLALSVFASGVGLAMIGLLLPVWADDTVSIVWWGLAAITIMEGNYGHNTTNKKAKRTT